MTPVVLASIALGGAAGALARYLAGYWAAVLWPGPLPIGTWLVNVLGCAAIGVLFVGLERAVIHPELRGALVVGFLGAFTTFSTFSLETVSLWLSGAFFLALAYTVATVLACLLATALGMALGRALFALS